MPVKTILDRLVLVRNLEVPKSCLSNEQVVLLSDAIAGETQTSWLIECSHALNPPATVESIESAEKDLGFPIPEQYRRFLEVADGAELFVVPTPWLGPEFQSPAHVWYRLFGCRKLTEVNLELFRAFRDVYSDDPELRDCHRLNYLAFCDADDSNYEAMLVQEGMDRRVFLLFHELFYRPYSDVDRDFYYSIADSLEDWLDLIIRTRGWGGRGPLTGSL
jgi:hypothetical protein